MKGDKSSEMNIGEIICDLPSARNVVRQVKSLDGDMEAQDAGTLVPEAPRREIADLIGKLMMLLEKLETDGIRIQVDIEGYAALDQRMMLTRAAKRSLRTRDDDRWLERSIRRAGDSQE